MLQFEPVLVQGATALNQLLQVGEIIVRTILRWLGGFALACLEIAAHYPAIGLISLVVNALIVWWLARALSPTMVSRPLDAGTSRMNGARINTR